MSATASSVPAPRGPFDIHVKLTDRIGDPLMRILTTLAGLAALGLLIWIAETVVNQAGPAIQQYGLSFVTSQTWDPAHNIYGAASFIYGTLVTSFIALILAAPTALAISIFLTELAPQFIRRPVAILVELLAAIPSVILGLWGIIVLGPFMASHLGPFLQSFLSWIPLFAGTPLSTGMLMAGLILAIMALPIITSITREVFTTTPAELKEGAYALGATRWEMVRTAVLPVARPGITGAVILGLGRALGEAIAVTQVIGNSTNISSSLFASGGTLAAQIASQYQGTTGPQETAALMYLGLILLVISVVVNVIARLIVRRGTARTV